MVELSAGREDLVRWVDSRPTNYFEGADNLREVIALRAGPEIARDVDDCLRTFGATVATVLEPIVATMERHRTLPALVAYDGVGRRVDRIEFHPDYHVATGALWGAGVLTTNERPAGVVEEAALFYLLSHVGEGGLACPLVCTSGLGRALAHRGSVELRERYLSRVRTSDAANSLRGSQFLTEVQGGSDVGANEMVAVPTDDGAYLLRGEKWFCSVADADLFAVTARPVGAPPGTRGLGCFLVPRTLDGVTPNGFSIRQLKDKFGTRCLASGEFDFNGAVGWPIGPVEEGFHVAVEELLNTSRWLNAVGSTGLMRRTYLEASSYAVHRRAFQRPIGSLPLVRDQVAAILVEENAALASTMALTALVARCEAGTATSHEVAVHRFLVNANKFVTSIAATDVVHRGIELLGGNGTIESFSPLPRLYRDAVVFESWEGTHNVLCAQIHRDVVRLGVLDEVDAWLRDELASAPSGDGGLVATHLTNVIGAMRATLHEPETHAVAFRELVVRLTRLVQDTCLLRESASGSSRKAAVAQLFLDTHVQRTSDAATRARLVTLALGDDLG